MGGLTDKHALGARRYGFDYREPRDWEQVMDDIVAKEAAAIAKREAALARRKAMAEWRQGKGRRHTRQLDDDELDFFG